MLRVLALPVCWRAAPLARVRLRGPCPEGLDLGPRRVLPPTFMLVPDSRASGRIEAYPGEDVFRRPLAQMCAATGAFGGELSR